VPLEEVEAYKLLCYPRVEEASCASRILELRLLGVEGFCLGPGRRVHLVGKGHTGVVLLGVRGSRLVAVKSRRTDSRRASLDREARLQMAASLAGAAPSVVGYTRDLIVAEYVGGPTLGEVVKGYKNSYTDEDLRLAVIKTLNALKTLDLAGVIHYEIHRPHRNVVFTDEPPRGLALIVDFDSADYGCGNLSKFASWLIRTFNISLDSLRKHLRLYKRSCSSHVEEVYQLLLDAIQGLASLTLRTG